MQLNHPVLSRTITIVKMFIQLFNRRIDVVPKCQLFFSLSFGILLSVTFFVCLSICVLSFRISDSFSSRFKLTVVRVCVCFVC